MVLKAFQMLILNGADLVGAYVELTQSVLVERMAPCPGWRLLCHLCLVCHRSKHLRTVPHNTRLM